jgi:hypothetical protein
MKGTIMANQSADVAARKYHTLLDDADEIERIATIKANHKRRLAQIERELYCDLTGQSDDDGVTIPNPPQRIRAPRNSVADQK